MTTGYQYSLDAFHGLAKFQVCDFVPHHDCALGVELVSGSELIPQASAWFAAKAVIFGRVWAKNSSAQVELISS